MEKEKVRETERETEVELEGEENQYPTQQINCPASQRTIAPPSDSTSASSLQLLET